MLAPPELGLDEKKAALQSVLQTASFLRAEQLRQFLRFVCDMEMSGRAAEITEYLIGVEALGRAPGYSTAEDSIVRRRAIDLRDKLDEIYETELASAPVRIELPKGRYVPHFVVAEPVVSTGAAVEPLRDRRRPFLLGFLAGTAAASAVFLVWRALAPVGATAPEPGVTYEAEAAGNNLHGATTRGECSGCSGGARVRNIGNSAANYVVVNGVMAGTDGNYTIKIDYSLQGKRSLFVRVNEAPPVELVLQGESWSQPSTVSLSAPLKAGPNTLTFGNEHSYAPDLDRVVVR